LNKDKSNKSIESCLFALRLYLCCHPFTVLALRSAQLKFNRGHFFLFKREDCGRRRKISSNSGRLYMRILRSDFIAYIPSPDGTRLPFNSFSFSKIYFLVGRDRNSFLSSRRDRCLWHFGFRGYRLYHVRNATRIYEKLCSLRNITCQHVHILCDFLVYLHRHLLCINFVLNTSLRSIIHVQQLIFQIR